MQMTMPLPRSSPKKDTLVKQIIEEKVDRIKIWMSMNHLQMNDTKTEFITFGTPHLLSKKNLDSLTIGGTTVSCSKTIKFLGAFLDETLSFKQHVAACAKLAVYGIHLIKNVRRYLTMATTNMLMCTLVLSQLDCINSILTNTPLTTTKPYQKSRTKLPKSSTKRPNGPVQHLPWNSFIGYQSDTGVTLNFSQLCIKLHGMGPAYLSDRLKIKNNARNTQLTSSTTLYLEVPFNKKRSFADRGFSYMATQHWNTLWNHIKIVN